MTRSGRVATLVEANAPVKEELGLRGDNQDENAPGVG
jgi:hypothetical protein